MKKSFLFFSFCFIFPLFFVNSVQAISIYEVNENLIYTSTTQFYNYSHNIYWGPDEFFSPIFSDSWNVPYNKYLAPLSIDYEDINYNRLYTIVNQIGFHISLLQMNGAWLGDYNFSIKPSGNFNYSVFEFERDVYYQPDFWGSNITVFDNISQSTTNGGRMYYKFDLYHNELSPLVTNTTIVTFFWVEYFTYYEKPVTFLISNVFIQFAFDLMIPLTIIFVFIFAFYITTKNKIIALFGIYFALFVLLNAELFSIFTFILLSLFNTFVIYIASQNEKMKEGSD